MKTKLLLAFSVTVLCLLPNMATAQTQIWDITYDGPLDTSQDYGNAMTVDPAGNVYVTGSRRPLGNPFDMVTIKYDTFGVQQWMAIYNGGANTLSSGTAITVDGAGNVYVTGPSVGTGTNYDYVTIKYNSLGVEQWVSRYNGPGNVADHSISIVLDASGNVYVTGFSTGVGTNYDYAVVKYNASGVEQWVARHNGLGNADDRPCAVAVDGSGNVYVTGYTTGTEAKDYTTIKYNSAGIQQWLKNYNGPGLGSDTATGLAVDNSGNVIVTGGSDGGTTTGFDFATLKYNTAGVQQWVSRYDGSGIDDATAITTDGTGNIYVTGKTVGASTQYDYATLKYNSAGIQQWVTIYNGPSNDWDVSTGIKVDGAGNIYVTGRSVDGLTTNYDYATLKYNSAGAQQWLKRYNGAGNDRDHANGIGLDASGNVYVSGYTTGIDTSYDIATVKYSWNLLGTEEVVMQKNQIIVSPNPAADYITIENKNNTASEFVILNAIGQRVANGQLSGEMTTVNINAFPSGIYFLNIGNTQSLKFIKK
jgi:uncharacterized delta-60 repeat protein